MVYAKLWLRYCLSCWKLGRLHRPSSGMASGVSKHHIETYSTKAIHLIMQPITSQFSYQLQPTIWSRRCRIQWLKLGLQNSTYFVKKIWGCRSVSSKCSWHNWGNSSAHPKPVLEYNKPKKKSLLLVVWTERTQHQACVTFFYFYVVDHTQKSDCKKNSFLYFSRLKHREQASTC